MSYRADGGRGGGGGGASSHPGVNKFPPACRVFIGNLATEKTNAREIEGIFAKYGRLAEPPVLRRSFGFVQFDDPRAAQAAIEREQGTMIGGLKVDLSLADNRPVRSKGEAEEGGRRDRDRKRDRDRGSRDDRGGARRRGEESGSRGGRDGRGGYDSYRERSRSRGRERGREGSIRPPKDINDVFVVRVDNPSRAYCLYVEENISNANLLYEMREVEIDMLPATLRVAAEQSMVKHILVVGSLHEKNETVTLGSRMPNGKVDEFKSDIPLHEAMRLLTSAQSGGPPDRGRMYDPRGPPPMGGGDMRGDPRAGGPPFLADPRGGGGPPPDFRNGPPPDFRGPQGDFRGGPGPNDFRGGPPMDQRGPPMGDYRGGPPPHDPRGQPNMHGGPPGGMGPGPVDPRSFDPRGPRSNMSGPGGPGPGGPGGGPRDDGRGGPPQQQGMPANVNDVLANLIQQVQNSGGISALSNEATRSQVLAALNQNPQLVQALVQKMPPAQQGGANQQMPPVMVSQGGPPMQGAANTRQQPNHGMPPGMQNPPPMQNGPQQQVGAPAGSGTGAPGGPGGLDLNSLQDLLAATAPLLGQGPGQQKEGSQQGPPRGYQQGQSHMQQAPPPNNGYGGPQQGAAPPQQQQQGQGLAPSNADLLSFLTRGSSSSGAGSGAGSGGMGAGGGMQGQGMPQQAGPSQGQPGTFGGQMSGGGGYVNPGGSAPPGAQRFGR